MPAYAWAALGVAIAASAAGIAFAAVRGLDAWRTYKAVRQALTRAIGDVTQGASAVERRLAGLGKSGARIRRARGRLQESLAELAVIRAAAGDVRPLLRVVGFLRR